MIRNILHYYLRKKKRKDRNISLSGQFALHLAFWGWVPRQQRHTERLKKF